MSPRKDPREGLLPSVTTILGAFPKDWMGPWAAKLTAIAAVEDVGWRGLPNDEAIAYLKGVPFRKRDATAEHGTAVHKRADALHKGADGEGTLEEEIERDFIARYDFRLVRSEFCMQSRTHGYAGTGDLLGHINGELWLIDRKTSQHISEEYELQLAAYAFSEVIVDDKAQEIYRQHWYDPTASLIGVMPPIERVGVLWIPRETPEEWKLVEMRAGQREFDAFLSVKGTFDYRRWAKQQPEPEEVPVQRQVEAA